MSDINDLSEHCDIVIVVDRMRGHDERPRCCLCGQEHVNASEKYEDAQYKEHPQALAYWMGKLYCQSCYKTLTLPYWEDLPKLHVVERS